MPFLALQIAAHALRRGAAWQTIPPIMHRTAPVTPAPQATARHVIVAFAASASPGCRQQLPRLQLQHLPALLHRLRQLPGQAVDPYSYTPPHEYAWAQALQWPAAQQQDGAMPWAALLAHKHAPAQAAPGTAWAFVTPCHWQIHADHVTMAPPSQLALDDHEAEALRCAMQPWFAEDGLMLHPLPRRADGTVQWLACGDMLDGLRTASLERVAGRHVDNWMPLAAQAGQHPASAGLRRLQSEMQMLLYPHPVNEARLARRQLPVNSFWISGAGTLPPDWQAPAIQPQCVHELAGPAMHEDWPAWQQAWEALDEALFGPLLADHQAGSLPALQVTLCSEQGCTHWQAAPLGLIEKALRQLRAPQGVTLLQAL